MIVATGGMGHCSRFECLLNETGKKMSEEAFKKPNYYLGRGGVSLEEDVCGWMRKMSSKFRFRNVELISGAKFPDIVTDKIYGVEVKSVKADTWRTTGN
ncbi:MAG: hypothetical protein ABIG11_08615, partial [bacterium]